MTARTVTVSRRSRLLMSTAALVTLPLAAAGSLPTVLSTAAQAASGSAVSDSSLSFTAKLTIGTGETMRGCSGALVDSQWVLSAASCFADDPQSGSSVTAGAPKLPTTAVIGSTDLTVSAGQSRAVVQLVPYAGRDVVLARLDKPVTDVNAVNVSSIAPAVGDNLTSSGFGRTKDQWAPVKLHTASFTVTDVQSGTLNVSGNNGESVCAGDTGGPVLRQKNGTLELVAVNSRSWQAGCFGTDASETRTNAVDARADDVAAWVAKNRLATMHADVTDVVTTADFNKDGRPDVAAILKDGNLHTFYATANGSLIYGRELWKHDGSWSRKTRIFGGDFNGDGNADIAAINVDGNFTVYPGTASGPLANGIAMWKDATWGAYPSIATYRAKGWTRDGLITVSPAGRLYAYPTAATGALDGTRTEVWNDDSWNKKLITSADYTSDQLNDVAAIGQDGALGLYAGNAQGKFAYFGQMWPDPSWASFPVMMGGDYNGDGKADIAAVNSTGGLYLYPGDGKGKLATRTSMWPTIG
ncbi:FG-GAP-like repeat-containing protein [Streptomyces sp. NPDC102406]|uniref:FG-GAP-like repeat-containing protein n=1 Tax=Streptomyces sp. NPDC102406 TaxID=3366171 RepID=UPI003804D9B8